MRTTVLFLFVPVLCVGLAAVAGSSASTTRAVAVAPPPAAKQIAALKRQVAAQRKQIKTLKATVKRMQTQVTALSPEGIAAQLARVKTANDKYQSVDAAKTDGYVAGSPCEKSPAGGMGIHYVNPAALADSAIDPMKPEILTYLPTASGLVLLAAEYFKADADQNLNTDTDRPTLFGRAFDGPMPGHSPTMPRHYDLHVWLWKHNPSGMFAEWNRDVACP